MNCIIFKTTIDGTDVLAMQSSSGDAIRVSKKGFFSVNEGIFDPPRENGFHDIISESDGFLVDQALMDEITKVSSGPFTDDGGYPFFDIGGVARAVVFSGKTVSIAPLLDLSIADLLVRTTYKRHEKVINDSFEEDDLWHLFGQDAPSNLTSSSLEEIPKDPDDVLTSSLSRAEDGDDVRLVIEKTSQPASAEVLSDSGNGEQPSGHDTFFVDTSDNGNPDEECPGNILGDESLTLEDTGKESQVSALPKSRFVSSVDLLFPDCPHPEEQELTGVSKEASPSLRSRENHFSRFLAAKEEVPVTDVPIPTRKGPVDTIYFRMNKSLLKDVDYHFITFCTSTHCTVRFGKITGDEDMISVDIEIPSKRMNRQALLTLVRIITLHHLTLSGGVRFAMDVVLDENPDT